jgi:hypothetical protein
MDKTLRQYARRLGVKTFKELREFSYGLDRAIFEYSKLVEDRQNAKKWETDKNRIFTPYSFYKTFGHSLDPRTSYLPGTIGVILQSIPSSKFYGQPKKAERLANVLVGTASARQISCVINQLCERRFFKCFFCQEKKNLIRSKQRGLTMVRDKCRTRDRGYSDEFFDRVAAGWRTQLCQECYDSLGLEYARDNDDQEVLFLAKQIKSTARRKNAA